MSETLISRTHAEGLRPLGTAGQRSYALVSQVLAERLGPEHAALFAEPSPSPDGVSVDWYAQVEGPVRALSDLPEEEAQAAQTRLGELTRDVLELADALDRSEPGADQRLAEALRNAVEVPDESAIRMVGDQPVLVSWAHAHDVDKAPRGVIRQFIPAHDFAPPAPAEEAVIVAEAPGRPAWLGWLWWLGWLLLLLLLLWILYLLIAPCALRGPAFLDLDRCPHAEEGPSLLDLEADRREALEDRIARLELDLARGAGACAPVPPEPAPAPPPPEPAAAPPPPPQEPPAPPQDARDDIDRRLEEAGGERGSINVILSWNDTADVDVHVTCPSGHTIFYGNKRACGGELDVDMNVRHNTRRAVENVVFAESPEPGRYKVEVRLLSEHRLRRGRHHPFTLKIVIDGEETVHRGIVSSRNPSWRTSFVYRGPQ